MQEPELTGRETGEAERASSEPSTPMTPAECEALWPRFREALRAVVQREQFETWFRRAELRAIDDKRIVLAVQNRFTKDWLTNHYSGALEQAARAIPGNPRAIENPWWIRS